MLGKWRRIRGRVGNAAFWQKHGFLPGYVLLFASCSVVQPFFLADTEELKRTSACSTLCNELRTRSQLTAK